MTWYVWMVTYLCGDVTMVRGASYHLLGSHLFQDSKIRFDFKLNLTSAISSFSKSWHLASYVSRHNAMAYDTCNSDSSAGNASTAFEYYWYEIEAAAPWFNYLGRKIKIPKQESPVTICTADTIGTIRSWRLFRDSLTWAQMSLWLRDQSYQKTLSQSCLEIQNLWGPSQVTLKCKTLSRCET